MNIKDYINASEKVNKHASNLLGTNVNDFCNAADQKQQKHIANQNKDLDNQSNRSELSNNI
jgi:hypothetical protein